VSLIGASEMLMKIKGLCDCFGNQLLLLFLAVVEAANKLPDYAISF